MDVTKNFPIVKAVKMAKGTKSHTNFHSLHHIFSALSIISISSQKKKKIIFMSNTFKNRIFVSGLLRMRITTTS